MAVFLESHLDVALGLNDTIEFERVVYVAGAGEVKGGTIFLVQFLEEVGEEVAIVETRPIIPHPIKHLNLHPTRHLRHISNPLNNADKRSHT